MGASSLKVPNFLNTLWDVQGEPFMKVLLDLKLNSLHSLLFQVEFFALYG
jgi:hypothetical protein